jgi:hypothetical protein
VKLLAHFALLLSFAAFAGPAAASDVYVVHGIPGQDLGLDPALPVDVCLADGTPILTGVVFGAIAGPLSLDPGRYDIEVRLADGSACGGPLATLTTLLLSFGENTSVVAHLDEQGAPALTKFGNDLRTASDEDEARLSVRHAAAVGPVSVELRRRNSRARIPLLQNGGLWTLDVDSEEDWTVRIFPFGSRRAVFGPASLSFPKRTLSAAYAVGSLANGTFTVLLQELPLN